MKTKLLPVVVAGGGGTRLWPLSRQAHPKQFIALHGQHSLLQATLLRLQGLPALAGNSTGILPGLLIGNEAHRFMILRQARDVACEPGGLVLEPEGRGTAAALTVAALYAQSIDGEDPVLLMLPADHLVRDEAVWQQAVLNALPLAQDGQLVTFGIPPDQPATGYGYIETGAAHDSLADAAVLQRFVEKPDRATAEQYYAAGNYLWNSGLFMLRASLWLKLIAHANPDILKCSREALDQCERDGLFLRLQGEAFGRCPNDSVDYAVMEQLDRHADVRACVYRMDCGWSDVGSWDSVRTALEPDQHGNARHGDVLLQDVQNSLVYADHRLVSLLSCRDLVVVETADAVLVADRHQAQQVRDIVDALAAQDREEHLQHRLAYRPWGSYDVIDEGERFKVKRIQVEPGHKLSLQRHRHRAEHWIVVRGQARVTRDGEVLDLNENESTFIPAGTRHRLENPGPDMLEIIEVQSGSYLGEDDIERFEDDFGRT
jgi:mannose-1-phosphate guanylyltransferase / mannose-6-phosphate isomerase